MNPANPVEPESIDVPAGEASSSTTADKARVGRRLASGAAWTIGGYGTAQAIRFATSIALTRLLAPELFGIMLIVNTVRTGAELLSDIGISQSVIRSPHGEEPAFYSTAWTLQIGRGVVLAAVFAALSVPVHLLYNIPILLYVLPAAGITLLINGFTSMAVPILRRRMCHRRLAIFEVVTAVLYSVFHVAVAFVYPTIWALVLGLIFSSLVTVLGSFKLETIKHTLHIDKKYLSEIIFFGKWITASTAIYFVTTNLDRIYLPAVLSLEVLGIFAAARSMTEVINNVFLRLNSSILFPHISSQADAPRDMLRKDIAKMRRRFLIVSALVVGLLAGSADLIVAGLFDQRFHQAGWMVSCLLVGTWFAILSSTAEVSLMGLGRPQAATFGNSGKLIWLVAALPLAASAYGMVAVITSIAASDGVRYVVTIAEQRRASFSFLLQDAAGSGVLIASIGLAVLSRFVLGFPPFI